MDNVIVTIIGFFVSLIPLMSVILKLNKTITELDFTVRNHNKQMDLSQEDRNSIHRELNDHETRITVLENK